MQTSLTEAELFSVWDVTLGLTRGLQHGDRVELVGTSVPLKVLGAVLRHVSSVFGTALGPGRGSGGRKRLAGKITPGIAETLQLGPKVARLTQSVAQDSQVLQLTASASAQPARMQNLKAARADDAAVPVWIWNDRLETYLGELKINHIRSVEPNPVVAAARYTQEMVTRDRLDWAAEILRRAIGHRWWLRHLIRDFWQWRRSGLAHARDIESLAAGLDACRRATGSTWWEWTAGSRLFFWRWPAEYLLTARDDLKPRFRGRPIRWVNPQRVPANPGERDLMRIKIQKVMDRGYIGPGRVLSLMNVFSGPKGEGDIRLVYDGTKSLLNTYLWAPWFCLPTLEGLLRSVGEGTWMGDNDIGEQFHNFVLHASLQPYCGIDLTRLFPERAAAGSGTVWERWTRAPMGVMQSPYQAAQGMIWWEQSVRGDRHDAKNPLRWAKVILNIPGSAAYQPSMPWVYKAKTDGSIANDFRAYVDDLRATGSTAEECWQVTRLIGSKATAAGIQDAYRKRREVSQAPGAWAGAVLTTTGVGVGITISQERWDKTKGILNWMREMLALDRTRIPFKTLESHRGFLIYVTRTYPAAVPYLKGIHLTLDSWREGRDDDGWAVLRSAEKFDPGSASEPLMMVPGAPDVVSACTRLEADLRALIRLFRGEAPAVRLARPRSSAVAIYGFGDASGYGFGSTLLKNGKILYRCGEWTRENAEESSNFREMSNLVLQVEEHVMKGQLEDCELFLFTNNSTAKAAFYKGTSSSQKLFNLVLQLRDLQMRSGMHLHVVHVAGKRMIAQGTDGVSRGDLLAGVFAGNHMLDYVPLHLTAVDRSETLLPWIIGWYPGALTLLDHNDWYDRVMNEDMGHCLWTPSPGAAGAAVEQLCLATLKRTDATHIIIIPRLLTSRWRKQLSKAADVVVTLPLGGSYWGMTQHEPLLLAICFPLIRSAPWKLRGSAIMERFEGNVRAMPPSGEGGLGFVLRELCLLSWALDSMPKRLVRSLLSR